MPDKDHLRFYRGRSMSGAFRPGECLRLTPIILSEVQPGDVVIFRRLNPQEPAGGDCQEDEDPLVSELHGMAASQQVDELVHRVVAIRPEGLVTRGDHNPCDDIAPVTERNLVGRVVYVERGGKLRPVRGGRAGLLHAGLLRLWNVVWKLITRLGREPYQILRASGLAPRFWRPQLMRIRLAGEDGPLVKYLYHGRTVARWWPRQGRFECQAPYDLVLRRPGPPGNLQK